MILHLVTDRKRLWPDRDEAMREAAVLEQARHAIEAGIDVIQIREADLPARSLARLVRAVVAAARGSATRVVVNDRLDVGLAAGADGVHLKGTSIDAVDVRRMAPERFLVGRSVHTVDEARAAGPVDYLIAGTVWPTVSKPSGHVLLGLDGLRDIVQAARVPVIAIGGITQRNAAAVSAAGASGVAAIGAFMDGAGSLRRALPLFDVVQAFRMGYVPDKMNG